MSTEIPLIKRKQQRARQRVLQAAGELFAAHGFDAVSVSDIAQAAEVGRTTFFRHFGDKQEVVFAREQELLDTISADHRQLPAASGRTATDALQFLQPLVLGLCSQISSDPDEYRRHMELIEQSVELRARSAAKMQLIAHRLSTLLVDKGWDQSVADFAGQIALACYWTARESSRDPAALVSETRAAFQQALALGSAAPDC